MSNRNPLPLRKRTAALTPAEEAVMALAPTMTAEDIATKLGLKVTTVRGRICMSKQKQRDLENLKVVDVPYGGR